MDADEEGGRMTSQYERDTDPSFSIEIEGKNL